MAALSSIVDSSSAYAATVLADNPTAYYRLGEASGTNLLDSSGNNLDGGYVNGTTLAQAGALDGDGDTAASFDGTDDYASVADSPALQMPGDLTIEAWVYRIGVVAETGSGVAAH